MLSVAITVILALLVVGVVLWAVQQFPIDPMIVNLIRVAVVVIAALWVIFALANAAGVGIPLR